ncbi:MAG: hypothetical protein Q9164_007802 [Protoblastenia rupestris]
MDTGCSGSLVALHQACQSLRTYETSMSLVGGINLILGQEPTIALSNAAQEQLRRLAYESVILDLLDTAYVEAHGIGTKAGDAAEVEAIANVFCQGRTDALPVGSIKSNIGHLESASGLASLVKAVLVLEKGVIPLNAGYRKPNPSPKLEERQIKVKFRLIVPFVKLIVCRSLAEMKLFLNPKKPGLR